MSNSLEDIFSAILVDCFAFFGTEKLVVPDYRIVENIATEYLALRPDVLERSSATVELLNGYNGFAVPPKNVGDVFTVLINKNVLMENLQNARADWIGTIVHETTHVQDFAQYAQIVGATEYDEILRTDLHGMFNLWSEIHARANGYYPVGKDEFLEGIRGLHVGEWRRNYDPRRFGYEVLDGTQWELEIFFSNGHQPVRKYGSNSYPYNFNKFLELLGIEPDGEETEDDD